MLHQFEVIELAPQATVSYRGTCTHDQIGVELMRLLPWAWETAQKSGLQPIGPPYCRYLDWRESDCDIEGGVFVDGAASADLNGVCGSLGGCRALHTRHTGPYTDLHIAHAEAREYAANHGLTFGGPPWEHYLTDPEEEPDASNWITDIYWPLT